MNKQKILIGLITTAIVTTGILGNSGLVAYAETQQIEGKEIRTELTAQSGMSTEKMKKDLEKYLVKNEDGTISLSKAMPKSFKEEYKIDKLLARFTELNKEVKNGDIKINDDFSITRFNESNSRILHHSSDYRNTYWWGDAYGYCGTCSKDAIYTLRKGGNSLGLIGIFFPVVGVAGAWFDGLANSMDYHRTSRGVVVDLNYALIYNCYGR